MVTAPAPNTIVLDNGGHNLKIEEIKKDEPRIIPNSIVKSKHERKRVFIANEQDDCQDKFSLFYVRPIERGYVANWDVQQQIWEKAFSHLNFETKFSRVVLTDNNYLIPALPDVSNEILFEYFGFDQVFKGSASTFVANHSNSIRNQNCSLIIDCGFSCTTVSPFVNGSLIQDGVVRIDVGGKALTNKLKDWISYRQLNVMEETHIINECKEDLCYVSHDFQESLTQAKKKYGENNIIRRYIMPDFHERFRGVIQDLTEEYDSSIPSIHLSVERFSIPEILFNPSDIDIDQMGIAEAVVESIDRCPEELRAALSENIIVIGGSAKFPGFQKRLLKEIRSMLPSEFDVNISKEVEDPQTHAWKCARNYVKGNTNIPWVIRKEWDERGDSLEYSRFFKTLVSSDELKETRDFKGEEPKTSNEE